MQIIRQWFTDLNQCQKTIAHLCNFKVSISTQGSVGMVKWSTCAPLM